MILKLEKKCSKCLIGDPEMKWTEKESKALDYLITGYGTISLLPEESREKLFQYAVMFHKNAFKITDKKEPEGLVR
jgi:hypothetical protein